MRQCAYGPDPEPASLRETSLRWQPDRPRQMVRLHEVPRPRGALGPAASRRGVRKSGRAHAAARPRHHIQVSRRAPRRCWAVPASPIAASGAATTARCSNSRTRSKASSINGVDIITFDADGRITHFKVMVRPLKAINLLHRLMGEELMASARCRQRRRGRSRRA